jgi:hypothetical protein
LLECTALGPEVTDRDILHDTLASYKCKLALPCSGITLEMASSDHHEWFPEPTTHLPSLDSMLTPGSLQVSNYGLPTISEDDWDFGWSEQFPTEPDPYSCFEQALPTAAEPKPEEAAPPQVSEDLINLQKQIEQLRQEIAELQGIFFKKLNSLEEIVMAAQRYVGNLVPWSIEVHEQYSKLLEVAERQEKDNA